MVVLYVDDAGISAPNQKIIDHLLHQLTTDQGLALTKEGSFEEFLGIQFDKNDDGSILLTQKGLTEKTLAAAGMTDCSPNKTPCAQLGLGSDPHGSPMEDPWNYASIVGMLLYLTTNTRPDIAFAVSQVARFTSSPRQSHAKAVKSILRYLKGTADKGMIIRPSKNLNIEAFVDADFAGLYGQEPDHVPEAAKSRTGYVITLAGCPVIWKSQLQGEIALSTTHAEYVALSQCMRIVLPFRAMIKEALEIIKVKSDISTTFKTTVFEDNMGAFYLATNQRLTSRSKHFLIKYHHFWESVRKGDVLVKKIETHLQNADYLTKGLPHEVFHQNRRRVQGWLVSVNGKDKLWLDSRYELSPNERESQETDENKPLENNLTPRDHLVNACVRADNPDPGTRNPGSPKATFIPQYCVATDEVKPGTSVVDVS